MLNSIKFIAEMNGRLDNEELKEELNKFVHLSKNQITQEQESITKSSQETEALNNPNNESTESVINNENSGDTYILESGNNIL